MKRPSLAALIGSPTPVLCRRCQQTVYPKEMVGPIHGSAYHVACFKCRECDLKLTLQAYHTNETSLDDGFVYCRKHAPKLVAGGISLDACNLQTAMKSQANLKEQRRPTGTSVNIGADAAYIKASMDAQKLRKTSKQTYSRHNYNPFILRQHEEALLKAKHDLEKVHREEEEKLLAAIQERRKSELAKVDKQVEQEWEAKLRELTSRFEKMMEKRKIKEEDKKQMTMQYESDKAELSRTLRMKKSKEKQSISSTMLPKERAMTSELIKKQSEEMLKMIASKDQELQTVISIDIGENGTDPMVPDTKPAKTFGEASTMTDLVGECPSLVVEQTPELPSPTENVAEVDESVLVDGVAVDTDELETAPQAPMVAVIQPALRFAPVDEPPGPCPPSVLKRELYRDPDEVFAELDEEVINIAEADQASFTDLCHQLTKSSHSDLEKARAIFRWITVKDLSVLDNESMISNPDTPLGILRGIKIGTETYHTLFMRLCSYAGIHCREIKGYSKSVGYEPGMSFEKHNFTNTWNAVYLDGDWRFVQCNWAARHLVFHRDMDANSGPGGSSSRASIKGPPSSVAEGDQPDKSNGTAAVEDAKKSNDSRRGDKLRYQYDEHYFLTDPDQFIAEFFPFEPAWQLLPEPITLEEFEMRPFVRSAFFQFGMRFPKDTRCVLEADVEGKTRVEILMEDPQSVVCHYQLRYADERLRRFTYFEGHKLDRFVVFQVLDDRLLFDIHIPTHQSPFYFEVFAAGVDPDDPAPHQQIKLKCVTKFGISCRRPIVRRMNPLPPSAAISGEWGPSKAKRHFRVRPLSHGQAVITETDRVSVQFWIPETYLGAVFSASLHSHTANAHLMRECVRVGLEGNILSLLIDPPASGQYALDLFMMRPGAPPGRPPSHVCKYLLNCTATTARPHPAVPDSLVRDHRIKPGATPLLRKLGISVEGEAKPKLSTGDDLSVLRFRVRNAEEVDFAYRYQLVGGTGGSGEGGQDHTDLVELSAEEGGLFSLHLPHIVAGTFQLYLCARRRGGAIPPPFDLALLMRIEKEGRAGGGPPAK